MDDTPSEREREQEAAEANATAISSSQERPASQQTFVFVDATAEAGRTREAIRVHVMRESHRSRRLARGQATSSANRGELQIWDTGSSSSDGASQASQTRRGSRGGSATRNTTRPGIEANPTPRSRPVASPAASGPVVSRHDGEESISRVEPRSPSPVSLLSAVRSDPFAQYPVQQTRDMDTLIDYCKKLASKLLVDCCTNDVSFRYDPAC